MISKTKTYTEECGRCCGTGHYSFNLIDGTMCYGCMGTGARTYKTSPKVRAAAKAKRDAKREASAAKREARAVSIRQSLEAFMVDLLDDPRCTPRELRDLHEGMADVPYDSLNMRGRVMAQRVMNGEYRPWIVRGLMPEHDGFNWFGEPKDTAALNEEVIAICAALEHDPDNRFLISLLDRVEDGSLLSDKQRMSLSRF